MTIAPNGTITDVNQAAEQVTGRSWQELIGTDFYVYFTDREKARRGFESVFREGFIQDYELEMRGLDGRLTPVLYNASVYRDENGKVAGIVALARDITERKRAEAEIRALNAGLEARIAQRTAELVAANRELEAFSYSVSHDLRAPLRAMEGFAKAIAEECCDKLTPDAQDLVQQIRGAAQRMAEIINGLLALARTSRAELRRTSVDLTALAQAVALDLQKANPGRAVEFDVAPGLVVSADPNLLRTVLENLLDNAWKFTGKHPRARIEVGALERSGERAYFVRDNGAGFDMTYAGKLFQAFQRLHSPAEFEGTGIGLATVQRIIQRHGGKVWAEGEVEKGATFFFTLPG